MERVHGIGGLFPRSQTPKALAACYDRHLGMARRSRELRVAVLAAGGRTGAVRATASRYPVFRPYRADAEAEIQRPQSDRRRTGAQP